MDPSDPRTFDAWIADLEARHLADLTFPQLSSALRALSASYVERRATIAAGGPLAGAGKRAAFALFYAPLHFLLVRAIVSALPGATSGMRTLVDLGCGTGAAGAAWASAIEKPPDVIAVDRHAWALGEAARTLSVFGLRHQTIRGDLASARVRTKPPAAVVAAFAANELDAAARAALLTRLLDRAAHGDRILVVEPIARFVARWWDEWRARVETAGGRADEWRIPVDLPPIVEKLDRAAGLHHRELTGRSLYLG